MRETINDPPIPAGLTRLAALTAELACLFCGGLEANGLLLSVGVAGVFFPANWTAGRFWKRGQQESAPEDEGTVVVV